jgi:hypothetical protein
MTAGIDSMFLHNPRTDSNAPPAGQLDLFVPRPRVRPTPTIAPPAARPLAPASSRPPLQIFASAQGGIEGAMILSPDPIAWIPRDARLDGVAEAYGCFVSGDSMEPAYEPGNLVLVNPAAPVGPGDDCVFLREAPDGTRYALIKRLVSFSRKSWTVRQHNPARTYTLWRSEWRTAHLVIGKFGRAT